MGPLTNTTPHGTTTAKPTQHTTRMDQQLDRVEADPSEVHQALYKLTSGPVGQVCVRVGCVRGALL